MTLLGMREDQEDQASKDEFLVSGLARDDDEELSLAKCIVVSTVAHPLSIGLIWGITKLILLLMMILGLSIPMLHRPEPKVKDIEFVLVDNPEQTPINKNTRLRADRNTRAGGIHDPKKAIAEPKPKAAKSTPQQQAAPAAPRVMQQPKHHSATPKTSASQTPAPSRAIPRPSFKIPNAFSIPVPRTKAPKALRAVDSGGGQSSSGPVTKSKGSSSPRPVMSPGSYGRPGNSHRSSGYSMGGGEAGNPGPGNPNGRPGIDAVKEPDFGPWMRDLQRRIKRNWEPPRGNESKRVVLFFKVARDGRLLELRVVKSSGVSAADQAAISAVQLTAPFRPLPPEYRKPDVDIQFTFDYNVFGLSGSY